MTAVSCSVAFFMCPLSYTVTARAVPLAPRPAATGFCVAAGRSSVGKARRTALARVAQMRQEPFDAGRGRRLELLLAPRGWMDECRSEEHTSELQSRELISYAVFCLKKKKK